jgi:hypothetical protein
MAIFVNENYPNPKNMKKWILKAIVQRTIASLPYATQINFLFQKYVTKGVFLSDEYFYDRLGHGRDHLNAYQKYSKKSFPQTSLEIGTGWYPVVPIAFFLAGTTKIYSVDITFLTSKQRVKTTIAKFLESFENGRLKEYVAVNNERIRALKELFDNYDLYTLQEVLQKLNVTYLVEDARKLSLQNDSIDLVNSNNTFEHIYPEILIPILKEFKRVLKKQQGVMSHAIDMSDHFAHFDKSISIYNFLQFSTTQWKWIDNNIQPQNRLRFSDYQKIFSDLQLPIIAQTFRPGNSIEVAQIPLAKPFSDMTPEAVAISHCYFVVVLNE